jgi:hypothetical protein
MPAHDSAALAVSFRYQRWPAMLFDWAGVPDCRRATLETRPPQAHRFTFSGLKAHAVPDRDKGAGKESSKVDKGFDTEQNVSDPYLKVSLLDADGYPVDTRKTAHIANVTDPIWEETLELQLPSYVPFPPVARFALYDEDGKKDTLISEVRYQLTQGDATKEGFAAATIERHPLPAHDSEHLAISFKYKGTPEPGDHIPTEGPYYPLTRPYDPTAASAPTLA